MEQQEVKGDAITPESNPIAYTLSVTTPDEVVPYRPPSLLYANF